ncbi:MAG: hypothetical protein AAF899_12540 [Pseudomonadota bacterium]
MLREFLISAGHGDAGAPGVLRFINAPGDGPALHRALRARDAAAAAHEDGAARFSERPAETSNDRKESVQ